MKMIHVISLFLVILGGVHFALAGFGVDLLHMIFGGANIAILMIAIGISTLYHVIPVFKAQVAAL